MDLQSDMSKFFLTALHEEQTSTVQSGCMNIENEPVQRSSLLSTLNLRVILYF